MYSVLAEPAGSPRKAPRCFGRIQISTWYWPGSVAAAVPGYLA